MTSEHAVCECPLFLAATFTSTFLSFVAFVRNLKSIVVSDEATDDDRISI